MYQQLSFLVAIAVLVGSCTTSTKVELDGTWAMISGPSQDLNLEQITFRKDSFYMLATYLLPSQGIYYLKNDILYFQDVRGKDFQTPLVMIGADTIVLFDTLRFMRIDEREALKFEYFDLAGIDSDQILSDQSCFFNGIQLYKGSEDILRLRLGDKFAEMDELTSYLTNVHAKEPLVLFLGESVSVRDLKTLYYHLMTQGQSSVTLATNRLGLDDLYIIPDTIEIWPDELDSFQIASKIPLRKVQGNLRYFSRQGLIHDGAEEIALSVPGDVHRLDQLQPGASYLVSISPDFSSQDYIHVKQRVAALRTQNFVIYTDIAD